MAKPFEHIQLASDRGDRFVIDADATRFAPGTVAAHEALDRAGLMLDVINRHLLEHPAIAMNDAWRKHAEAARESLLDLHQAIQAVEAPPS